jgi:hypothetical protein
MDNLPIELVNKIIMMNRPNYNYLIEMNDIINNSHILGHRINSLFSSDDDDETDEDEPHIEKTIRYYTLIDEINLRYRIKQFELRKLLY